LFLDNYRKPNSISPFLTENWKNWHIVG